MASTELHDQLWENAQYLKDGLAKLGFNTGESETPITPVIIGDEKILKHSVNALKKKVFMLSLSYSLQCQKVRVELEICLLQHIQKKC